MIRMFAAFSAALAIGAAAFGAHSAEGKAVEWLHTGGMYQLIHAVAALSLVERARSVAILMLIGGAVFALSLYAMAIGAPRWFGAVTPIGGAIMIGAWLWLGIGEFRDLNKSK